MIPGDFEASTVHVNPQSGILVLGKIKINNGLEMESYGRLMTANAVDLLRLKVAMASVDVDLIPAGDVFIGGYLDMHQAEIVGGDGLTPAPTMAPSGGAARSYVGADGTTGGAITIRVPRTTDVDLTNSCLMPGKGGGGGPPCTPQPFVTPYGESSRYSGGNGAPGGDLRFQFTDSSFTTTNTRLGYALYNARGIYLADGGDGYGGLVDMGGLGGLEALGGAGGESGWFYVDAASGGGFTMGDVDRWLKGGNGGNGGPILMHRGQGTSFHEPGFGACRPPSVSDDPPMTSYLNGPGGPFSTVSGLEDAVNWTAAMVEATWTYYTGGSFPLVGWAGSADVKDACKGAEVLTGAPGDNSLPGDAAKSAGPFYEHDYEGRATAVHYAYGDADPSEDTGSAGAEGKTYTNDVTAEGGPGGPGFLRGGDGGEAESWGCNGGHGGKGGNGADGGDAAVFTPPRICEAIQLQFGEVSEESWSGTAHTTHGIETTNAIAAEVSALIAQEEATLGRKLTGPEIESIEVSVRTSRSSTESNEVGNAFTAGYSNAEMYGYSVEYVACTSSIAYYAAGGAASPGHDGGKGGDGQSATAIGGHGGDGLLAGGAGGNAASHAGVAGVPGDGGLGGNGGDGCFPGPDGAHGLVGPPGSHGATSAEGGDGGKAILASSPLTGPTTGATDGPPGTGTPGYNDPPQQPTPPGNKPPRGYGTSNCFASGLAEHAIYRPIDGIGANTPTTP